MSWVGTLPNGKVQGFCFPIASPRALLFPKAFIVVYCFVKKGAGQGAIIASRTPAFLGNPSRLGAPYKCRRLVR